MGFPFAKDTKRSVIVKQGGKCAICHAKSSVLIYVRLDGNMLNNDISNCMTLCPRCKKTSGLEFRSPIATMKPDWTMTIHGGEELL